MLLVSERACCAKKQTYIVQIKKDYMRYLAALFVALLPLPLAGGACAQSPAAIGSGADFPPTTGTIIQAQPNTTGNDRDVIIAPGATGAETITTNSAAGGNSSHPERAVPNGSAGGGSGGQGGG
jgi:hypothetical protein